MESSESAKTENLEQVIKEYIKDNQKYFALTSILTLIKEAMNHSAQWQKERSANDAIEFDNWKLKNSVRIRTKAHTDLGLMWIHDGAEYSSKQLYELWQQNK